MGRVYDVLGHALGLLSFARPRMERGVAHYQSARGLASLVLTRRGFGAITFGRVVVSTGPLSEREWAHELAHVEQYERLGLAFIPIYVWHYLRVGYADNPLEREAVARAEAVPA